MPDIKEKTVNFGDLNSLDDLGIMFKEFTIDPPTPQINTIQVPYRNGSIDLTEYFGDIRYDDRNLNFTFIIPWSSEDQPEIYSNVLDKLHGKTKKIILASDPDWYYNGRITVGQRAIQDGFWSFPVTALCYPFKLRDVEITYEVTSETEYNIFGYRMPAVPTITIELNSGNTMHLTLNGTEFALGEGVHKSADFILTEGDNSLIVDGDGTITLTYQEGRL